MLDLKNPPTAIGGISFRKSARLLRVALLCLHCTYRF